jgi:hypothetical protein
MMLQQKVVGGQTITDESGNKINVQNFVYEKPEKRQAFRKCLIFFMIPILNDVMMTLFGNYLCQKIVEESDN